MSAHHHVFHDPSGKRKRFFKISIILFLLSFLALTWYAQKLFHRVPELPIIGKLKNTDFELEFEKSKKISHLMLKNERAQLAHEINKTKSLSKRIAKPVSGIAEPRLWSIYEPGSEGAYFSFRAKLKKITDLILPTFILSSDATAFDELQINLVLEEQVKDTFEQAKKEDLKIYGRISNQSADGFSIEGVGNLIKNQENHAALIQNLILKVQSNNLAGLIIDFRDLDSDTYFNLVPFFTELRKLWDESGIKATLGITYSAALADLPLWKYGVLFDTVLMRTFGEHGLNSKPGPVSSVAWFNQVMQFAIKNIPMQKLVVLFDNSAMDWDLNRDHAEIKTYLSVISKIKEITKDDSIKPSVAIDFDQVSLNSNYGYVDELGAEHRVWFGDAVNSYNQYSLALLAGIQQYGVWSLGLEDPGVWSFLGRDPKEEESRKGLNKIIFPYEIQFEGRGDILRPQAEITEGQRSFKYDQQAGLITENQYLKYPSAIVVEHRGYQANKIAITFDDGPVYPFTEELLKVFDENKVKASFFVIGEHVQEHPELLKKIYKAGHDIGNHTFSHPELSLVSNRREILELNSTQRLVQSVLGRSLVLFRPPYISEGSPSTQEEVRVIKTAEKLNYVTVGVSADARDWDLYKQDQNGEEVLRTGKDLADEIISKLEVMQGNVVLFHDGPTQREATVEAVKILIPELKGRGYQLVSISELLGISRDEILPKVSTKELFFGGLGRLYIEFIFLFRKLLEFAFILVSVFGVVRLLSFIFLSNISVRREIPFDSTKKMFSPPVSIIIAAYNEEKVIARTIRSLLVSDYPEFEIIVVDDGSSDNTSQVVQLEFSHEPRVRLIKKENGGKSTALNVGLLDSRYDFIIGLDADTQYSTNAIAAMVRHFEDPEVGAVAGNVKVGNRNSWLLQCQSIEYITNQNFGRRAFSVADAIPVVPGAAGAWRKVAIMDVGMYLSDTLGEDMELTWRVRKAGYKIVFEPRAYGYTEAPEKMAGVFKQRFRWVYGQLQVLWKHRDVFFNADYKWFGWFGAPLVLMDDLFLFLSPLADLQALIAIITFVSFFADSANMSMEAVAEAAPLALFAKTMILYAIFFITEVLCTVYAFKIDKEPLRPIILLLIKQFFYRQLMYIVTYKAAWRALTGWRQKWGVLHRTGTVAQK